MEGFNDTEETTNHEIDIWRRSFWYGWPDNERSLKISNLLIFLCFMDVYFDKDQLIKVSCESFFEKQPYFQKAA